MQKIWVLLKKHPREDFSGGLYLSIAVLLALSITINYMIDLEDGIIDKDVGKPIRVLWYFLLFGFAYHTAAVITLYFNGRLNLLRSANYWVYTTIGLVILSWNVGFPYLTAVVRWVLPDYRVFSWAYSTGSNLINFLTNAAPLFFVMLLTRKPDSLGVTCKNVDLKPYGWILLILVPIVAIGSFEPGFKNYYPTYRPNAVAEAMHWPMWLPPLLYELAYGLDFFNVEIMFRGFMVIGLSQWLGKDAILPMVVTYCFLHFGKPVGEAISSIAGGYVLGVLAFYTRNIWGGVLVHMGLAWMMELAAWLQKNI